MNFLRGLFGGRSRSKSSSSHSPRNPNGNHVRFSQNMTVFDRSEGETVLPANFDERPGLLEVVRALGQNGPRQVFKRIDTSRSVRALLTSNHRSATDKIYIAEPETAHWDAEDIAKEFATVMQETYPVFHPVFDRRTVNMAELVFVDALWIVTAKQFSNPTQPYLDVRDKARAAKNDENGQQQQHMQEQEQHQHQHQHQQHQQQLKEKESGKKGLDDDESEALKGDEREGPPAEPIDNFNDAQTPPPVLTREALAQFSERTSLDLASQPSLYNAMLTLEEEYVLNELRTTFCDQLVAERGSTYNMEKGTILDDKGIEIAIRALNIFLHNDERALLIAKWLLSERSRQYRKAQEMDKAKNAAVSPAPGTPIQSPPMQVADGTSNDSVPITTDTPVQSDDTTHDHHLHHHHHEDHHDRNDLARLQHELQQELQQVQEHQQESEAEQQQQEPEEEEQETTFSMLSSLNSPAAAEVS